MSSCSAGSNMSVRRAAWCDSAIADLIRSFLADDAEFARALVAEAQVAFSPAVRAWLDESGCLYLAFQDHWFLEDWDSNHLGDLEEDRDRWLESLTLSDEEDFWASSLFWDLVRENPDNFGFSP